MLELRVPGDPKLNALPPTAATRGCGKNLSMGFDSPNHVYLWCKKSIFYIYLFLRYNENAEPC